jgi:hypothetical protein
MVQVVSLRNDGKAIPPLLLISTRGQGSACLAGDDPAPPL